MDYYDGNTVTALWNYAQHYTLNDNSYDTSSVPRRLVPSTCLHGQTPRGRRPTAVRRRRSPTAPTSATRTPHTTCAPTRSAPNAARSRATRTTVPEPNGVTMRCPERTSATCSTQEHHLGLVPGRLPPSGFVRNGLPDLRRVARRTSGAPRRPTTSRITSRSSTTRARRTPYHAWRPPLDRSVSIGDHRSYDVNHQYDLSCSGPRWTTATCPP